MDLWDLLKQNAILLVLFGGWILSLIGGAITRAAAKAQQRALQSGPPVAQQAPRRTQQQTMSQPMAQRSAPPAPRPAKTTSPEDVAAEIRRMMGLEPKREAPRPEPQQRAAEAPIARRPTADEIADAREEATREEAAAEVRAVDAAGEPTHGGHLADELHAKAERRATRFGNAVDERARAMGAGIRGRHHEARPVAHSSLEASAPAQSERERSRSTRVAGFDVANPAAGIVALEVFGAPRAIRAWDGP